MKNTIILILSLFLAYFVLDRLGAFQFGSIIENNDRDSFALKRDEAVKKAKEFNIAVVANTEDKTSQDSIKGIEYAIEKLNKEGGIANKQIKLHFTNAENLTSHNTALQDYSMNMEIALCISPFNSDYIPSMRALSQYHALPLISPLTVFSQSLAPLEEENFITFFPPIKDWTDAIAKDMKAQGYKNILIISPEENSYGNIFASSLETASQNLYNFEGLYRLNYQRPFRKDIFSQVFNRRSGHNVWEAIVFCGSLKDFFEFCSLAKDLKISASLYGSDDLDSQELLDSANLLPSTLKLPYAKYNNNFLSDYKAYLGADVIFALKEVLKDGYNAKKIIDSLYDYRDTKEYKDEHIATIEIKEIENK